MFLYSVEMIFLFDCLNKKISLYVYKIKHWRRKKNFILAHDMFFFSKGFQLCKLKYEVFDLPKKWKTYDFLLCLSFETTSSLPINKLQVFFNYRFSNIMNLWRQRSTCSLDTSKRSQEINLDYSTRYTYLKGHITISFMWYKKWNYHKN